MREEREHDQISVQSIHAWPGRGGREGGREGTSAR